MRIAERLDHFVGEWTGRNGLRMMPDDDFADSPATAAVGLAAGGNVATVSYTWADFEGAPQEGFLLLSDGPLPGQVDAVWADSWHQSPRTMAMAGSVSTHRVSVSGTYGEGDQTGGWHIHLHLDQPDGLTMTMDNEVGDSGVYEVVRAAWQRA